MPSMLTPRSTPVTPQQVAFDAFGEFITQHNVTTAGVKGITTMALNTQIHGQRIFNQNKPEHFEKVFCVGTFFLGVLFLFIAKKFMKKIGPLFGGMFMLIENYGTRIHIC
eukprot:298850_1